MKMANEPPRAQSGPTPGQIDQIIDERLGYYRRRMRETQSTPQVCIGIGQGEQSGRIVVCMTEDALPEFVRRMLLFAADELARQEGLLPPSRIV
jgi:hypothetical protein